MLTGKQLAEYCGKVYAAKWVYWYGTYGKKCTESLYQSKKKQYPTHYTAARAAAYKKDIAEGRTCADCVGMIKSFFWTDGQFGATPKYASNHCPDVSANGMIALCKQTGPIKSIPDEPGLVVWKSGHIGVYVGGGYTIEMRGFDYDCVKRKVTSGPWTKWGRLPESMISYGQGEETATGTGTGEAATGLKAGDYGTAVKAMQNALLDWEPNCLPKYGADGEFGSETEKAVKAFQSEKGLPVTGVYDEATREALTAQETGTKEPETGESAGGCPAPSMVRATGDVNVRSAPGTNGTRVLGVLKKGKELPYQGQTRMVNDRDWFLVEFNGQNGWVSSKYAEVILNELG